MKKVAHLILPSLIFTACIIGCTNSSKEATDNLVSFISMTDTATYELVDMTKEHGKPIYSIISYSLVYPEKIADHNISELQDSIISKVFGIHGTTLANAIDDFLKSPLGIEESATKEIKQSESKTYNGNIFSSSGYVTLFTPDLLIFRADYYQYRYHAAHGMYGSTFINYHIPTGNVLSSDDLFSPLATDSILSTIKTEAINRYNNTGMLTSDEIKHFNNFYLTDNSIIFVYQPYEIGAYALGLAEIAVNPYTISNYLTPLGKDIFGINY